MYGAILGDIVGSPYEFDCNNYKAKDFPLFSRRSDFTDDTVMTLAVAKVVNSSSMRVSPWRVSVVSGRYSVMSLHTLTQFRENRQKIRAQA